MPEIGAMRLAALFGALLVGVAAAWTDRLGFTQRQTVAFATLVIVVGVLLLPSLRVARTHGHGQLQSVGGVVLVFAAVWVVVKALDLNMTVQSFLLGIIGFTASLTFPAMHPANAPRP